MKTKSPEQVSGPPVGSTVCSFHVHQHLSGFLPAKQQHGRQKTWNTEQEELQWSTTKNSVDTWNIEQNNEDDSFTGNTTKHVLIDTRVNQRTLK